MIMSSALATYGFRFTDAPAELLRIVGVGRERVASPDYRWHGLRRGDRGCLFQYTLAGEGALRIGETTHRVRRNRGFLVMIPSDHEYYYDPSSGEPWEFVWLMADGEDAFAHWRRLIREAGHLPELAPEATPIRKLAEIWEEAARGRLRDPYENSVRCYDWILSMRRSVAGRAEKDRLPEPVRLAMAYMDEHYRESIGLDEIAGCAGVSKHHLCRLFRRHTGQTPILYLRKKRVEEAARLLRQTSLPVARIARDTGFDNGSYFGKVFRSLLGLSPGEFREGRHGLPVDALFIE